MMEDSVLLFNKLSLVGAALPAVSPIANQEFEAKGIDFHARLEADAQVSKVHFILVRVSEKQAEMACNGKKQVVVEWGKIRELVDEQLGDFFGALTLTSNLLLGRFREELIG